MYKEICPICGNDLDGRAYDEPCNRCGAEPQYLNSIFDKSYDDLEAGL
ncbi:MAG: hypothetical protein ACFFG0_10490 [Candidatus Thorarchaeota archaeon]